MGTSYEEVYDEIKRHIARMAEGLIRKGYTEKYTVWVGPAITLYGPEGPSTLKAMIEAGMRPIPLIIMTGSYYKNDRDKIECIFKAGYSEKKGIEIESLQIFRHGRHKDFLRNKFLSLNRWEKVPAAGRINRMMGVERKQKRKGL